jgi:hypothetical protein
VENLKVWFGLVLGDEENDRGFVGLGVENAIILFPIRSFLRYFVFLIERLIQQAWSWWGLVSQHSYTRLQTFSAFMAS